MPDESARPPLVIALTGPVGSGLSTISKILGANDFERRSISSIIKAEYNKGQEASHLPLLDTLKSDPDWRKKLQDFGNQGRKLSRSHWIELALQDAPKGKELVIDGIRNLGEIEWLRRNYPQTFLIAVVAPKDSRWARVQSDYQHDYRAFNRDEQRDLDEDILNGQQVQKCVLAADYVFLNNDILGPSASRDGKILASLSQDIALMRGDGNARLPNRDEVHMATAYAQSFGSRCLKRFVGAVIVAENGLPLALGFNENPFRMRPCEIEFGSCYKDDVMHEKLEKMQDVFCPRCGRKHLSLPVDWKCEQCREDLKLFFFPSRNMELCTALHAEERAIMGLNGRSALGATMYVTAFPCFQCSRYIVDAGISRVVYVEPYPIKKAAEYLQLNGVVADPFQGFKARAYNLLFKQRD